MKKLLLVIFIIVSANLNAQESTAGELMINVIDNNSFKEVSIAFQLVSDFCWTAKDNIHDLTTSFYSSTIYTNTNEQLQFHGCWEVDSALTQFLD